MSYADYTIPELKALLARVQREQAQINFATPLQFEMELKARRRALMAELTARGVVRL